ncbi:MAG: AMP-binding protein [Verrucomicrobia bacterium]|nr:AMP-binding protein [Verrucomicrobiota bacterium]
MTDKENLVEGLQLEKLRHLLGLVRDSNRFYKPLLAELPPVNELTFESFCAAVPFTTKDMLSEDQAKYPPFGSNHTFPIENYCRFHQTSGSTGNPIRWLDTAEDWQTLLNAWKMVYQSIGIVPKDRIYFAFSFGPFLGFWTAFEAAGQMGMLCIPGGGLNTLARVKAIFENRATVLCCTPTYAIHLAHTARAHALSMDHSSIRHIVVAEEPGGSIPEVKQKIEALWPGSRVHDHHGMTETGPVTYPCAHRIHTLRVFESNFFAEIIDPVTLRPAHPESSGELVLTTLTRVGSPLIRYRTGDLVKLTPAEDRLIHPMGFEGGILGRVDDMIIVRGVNIFPSAVDAILSQFGEVAEYQVNIDQSGAMTEISITVELQPQAEHETGIQSRIESALRNHFNLRIPVCMAPMNSLPRFEMKSRRWIRKQT